MSDKNSRQQALDTTKSFIVQAPAGSGKTTLLLNRYLALLGTCVVPESVLVMTFTNQAVAELRERLTQILQNSRDKTSEVLPHQTQTHILACAVLTRSDQLGWALLDNLERLQISTIDSLSNSLVQSQAVLTKLMPSTVITDSHIQTKRYQQTIEEVLLLIEDADYRSDISRVLLHLDNNTGRFISLFLQMLGKRDQWLRHIVGEYTTVIKHTSRNLISQYLTKIQAVLCSELSSDFLALVVQSPKLELATIDFFTQLNTSQILEPETISHFEALAQICLTKKGEWRKSGVMGFTKKNYPDQAEQLANCIIPEDFASLLNQCTTLPSPDLSEQDAQVLDSIIVVLKLCAAKLMVNFAKNQAVDFVAIAMGAVDALNDEQAPSNVSLYLEHTLDHILIDEFQDTSHTQFSLLLGLTKNWQSNGHQTLFLVGDPMQSIYRFREARVELFLQAQQTGVGNIQLTALQLSHNFRSTAKLIASNNNLFSSIFPSQDDAQTGAIAYHPSTPGRQDLPSTQSTINFYPIASNETEAQTVVETITNILATNNTATIAVLVRARSHLSNIIEALVKRNIAFDANKIDTLADNAYCSDLLCLVRCVDSLADKLAWLSLLRAPWCGLVLADLLILSDEKFATLWQAIEACCQPKSQDLSPDGKQRLQTIWQIFTPVIEQRGRFELIEIIPTLLTQLGSKAYLSLKDEQVQTLFLDLLAQSDSVEQLTDKLIHNRINTASNNTQSRVVLMTIPSAKGLEFDHIILPGLHKRTRSSDASILPMAETNVGLLCAPIKSEKQYKNSKTYNYLTLLNQTQSANELMRVLYVAMTRAKSHIHLLGQNKPIKNTLLSLLWSKYNTRFDELETHEPDTNISEPPKLYRYPKLITPNIPTLPAAQDFISLNANTKRAYQAIIGTLTHQYLQHHKYQDKLPAPNTIKQHLKMAGLPIEQVAQSAIELSQNLEKLRQADFYTWLFTPRDSTKTEACFYLTSGKKIIIDRLFIDQDTVWIIDYKTTNLKPHESLDDFLSQQQIQHQPQLEIYQTTLKKHYTKPIKTALCFVALPYLLRL